MYICFAEYKIMPEHREPYLAFVNKLVEQESRVKVYEGSDQRELFVEIWTAQSQEEADAIKEERCGERSSWHAVSQWIAGGEAKLHVWTFKPI
ncbi:hypothetical protein A7K91_12875 [Paenibacillus oryzae]|uniref:ABM domain-containing protein n=1 Tax=Paenibacillus oryzae TaxID=1844972 RepID=A0A1A5YFM0_9BACL|nr:hypothetical protein [Paenibacillus oryzae]OBR64389.1 hypothetical protein A7K91_12875 [Paenibacillus oryzae]